MFPAIVCPFDKLPLTESTDELVCSNGHRWKVLREIPRMVLEQSNYADPFGLQWNTFRQTQLDSHSNTSISYKRLRRCLGEECWAMLSAPKRCDILEAGSGAGRFTDILLGAPSAYVTSTDYSSAVEANLDNCPQSDRHRVIQADILFSPFHAEQFDLVLCLGVIQHTPNTEETIGKLFNEVKPGGWLVFDHYALTLRSFLNVNRVIRPVFKRLPPETALRIVRVMVRALFPVHRAVRHRRYLHAALNQISPITTYFIGLPDLSDSQHYEWSLLDTHDSLTDFYRHRRTK